MAHRLELTPFSKKWEDTALRAMPRGSHLLPRHLSSEELVDSSAVKISSIYESFILLPRHSAVIARIGYYSAPSA